MTFPFYFAIIPGASVTGRAERFIGRNSYFIRVRIGSMNGTRRGTVLAYVQNCPVF